MTDSVELTQKIGTDRDLSLSEISAKQSYHTPISSKNIMLPLLSRLVQLPALSKTNFT